MAGRVVTHLRRRVGVDPIGGAVEYTGVAPRALLAGLVARSRGQAEETAMSQLINGVVVEGSWRVLQPTANAALSGSAVAALVADLDWAVSVSRKVRLRLFTGDDAPAALISAVGAMTWWSNDNPDRQWRQFGPVPCWWRRAYHEAYEDFMGRVALAVGSHPALAEVCMSLGATNGAEPFIHQFSYEPNRVTALQNGWTQDLDVATSVAGFDAHTRTWLPLRTATYMPFNPYQGIDSSTGKATHSTNVTLGLMESCVEKLQRCGVVANNSLMSPKTLRGSSYSQMYDRMISLRGRAAPFPVPVAFQTATLAKHKQQYETPTSEGYLTTRPFSTVAMAQGWEASSVEIPSGVQNDPNPAMRITTAQAGTFNAAFVSQTAELLG